MKPTLVVLAAGMGSRYGGVKQIDAVGKNGECLLDFSAYDARKAGFGKVVFTSDVHHRILVKPAIHNADGCGISAEHTIRKCVNNILLHKNLP